MNKLQDKAFQVLSQRSVWEQKQRLFYLARHDGIRRVNKPWPSAADSHFPLIDMQIGNLKPFWCAQIFNGDRLSDFLCLTEQLKDLTESAADYFHWEMMYRTQWRIMAERAVDTMLLRGRGVLKIVYDPYKNAIVVRSIDPYHILMAEQYDDFDDSDYFVEIQHVTVPQYQRNRNFNQDEGVINAIRGKTDTYLSTFMYEKQVREGITHSNRDDIIVLWNFYERTASGWKHTVHSPLNWEKKIRDPIMLPYEWQGEPLQPFYSLTMELKDEGWYSPRGIAELNAAFEAYCNKLWNDKSDAMTFGNKPLFTSQNEIQNVGNLRFMPGEFIPGNIQAVQMPQPAFSFDTEINFVREVAEQRSRMPDYGIHQEAPGGKPRTATENNRIAELQDVGADHNGEMLRSTRLTKIYRHCWALMCHRATVSKSPDPMIYYAASDLKTLSAQVIHDKYLIQPAGQAGTKRARLARAVARYQLFKGAPNINQDELASDVLASEDSRLVKKLMLPGNLRQQKESEDEAGEVLLMKEGFPATVSPGEDHIVRIMCLVGWLEKQGVTKEPVNPIALQRVHEHLATHFQMLKQTNPQAAAQLKQQIQQMEQQQHQPQMNGQPRGMIPTNGQPMNQ